MRIHPDPQHAKVHTVDSGTTLNICTVGKAIVKTFISPTVKMTLSCSIFNIQINPPN
jgi:hypothetical protein